MFDVITMRYKDKGTSLMMLQWLFRSPSAFLTTVVRPSNTVFIRWFRPDKWLLRGGASIARVRDSPIWIQPRGVFHFNPTLGSEMNKNHAIIIQFVLPLMTFYQSGGQKSNVYKQHVSVTSWRFHNHAWQPQRHDRLPETSGTLWIHRGALTNQRCSLATGCGINKEFN